MVNNHQIITSFNLWLSNNGTSQPLSMLYQTHVDDFISWINSNNDLISSLNPNTFNSYRSSLNKTIQNKTGFNQIIHSLRVFGTFLHQTNILSYNPAKNLQDLTQDEEITPKPQNSILDIFQAQIKSEGLSANTVKNYLNDIEQFFAWLHQYSQGVSIDTITPKTIEQFQKYLQLQLNFAPASIHRKVASLKKFFNWASHEQIFPYNPFTYTQNKINDVNKLSGVVNLKQQRNQLKFNYKHLALYTSFIIIISLLVSIIPAYLLNTQSPQQNIVEVEPDTQPNSTDDTWKINFSGKLTDIANNPIQEESEVVFYLYDTPKSKNPIWESSIHNIIPAGDGSFSTTLGEPDHDDPPINSQYFFQNEKLFIALSINGEEVGTRTQISTASQSSNSLKLNNYQASIVTQPLQIPVINESGQLTFASDSTKIKSLSGSIGIEGESITLATPYTSSENITLAALGGGGIDIITNNYQNNSLSIKNAQLVTGSLLQAQLASDIGTANLIDLQSGSNLTSKFTVDARGNTTITGKLIGKEELYLSDKRTNINLSDDEYPNLPHNTTSLLKAINLNTKIATQSGIWTKANDTISPYTQSNFLSIYGDGTDANTEPLEVKFNSISAKSGELKLSSASKLSLLTSTLNLSNQATSIDLADSEDFALNFERGALNIDTENTTLTSNYKVKLGSINNYTTISKDGNITMNNGANTITGNSGITLNTTGIDGITLTTVADSPIVLETINNPNSSGIPRIEFKSPILDLTNQATIIKLIDNTNSALSIAQDTNSYFNLDTTDNSEAITIGNATTNPNLIISGSGTISIPSGSLAIGSSTANVALDVTGDLEIANTIFFNNSSTEKLSWNSSEFVLSDDLLPETNNTYNLGSNTYRWQDLYLGPNSLYVGTSTNQGKINYNTSTQSFLIDANNDSTTNLSITGSGFLGIGTATPSAALDLTASAATAIFQPPDITSNDTTSKSPYISLTAKYDSDTSPSITTSTTSATLNHLITSISPLSSRFAISIDSNEYLSVKSNGNIGISNTNPNYALDVSGGDINSSSGGFRSSGTCVAGTCASDQRLKTNITTLANVTNRLTKLEPVQFSYTNPSLGTGVQTGLIAQQVEQIFPTWVTTGSDGYKKINYGIQIPIYNLQAIKELNQKLDQQGELINHLSELTTTKSNFLQTISRNTKNAIQQITQTQPDTTSKQLSPIKEQDIQFTLNPTQNISISDQNNQSIVNITSQGHLTAKQISSDKANLKHTTTESLLSHLLTSTDAQINSSLQVGTSSRSAQLAVSGSASISGNLTAQTITSRNARFDHLEANSINAKNIHDLDTKIKTAISELNLPPTTTAPSKAPLQESTLAAISPISLNIHELIASQSSQLIAQKAKDISIENSFTESGIGFFHTYLAVLGQTSLTTLDVTNQATINKNLLLTSNSITDLSNTKLSIQANGKGLVDILAGTLTINQNGSVVINGNLHIAGNLNIDNNIYSKKITSQEATLQNASISGKLIANNIYSNNNNITMNLNNNSINNESTASSKLLIARQNKTVASIDASGSATFNKLIIANASPSTSSGKLNINTPNSTQISSNATAGNSILPAHSYDITITNPNITPQSLVYITPTSDTKNQVLFLKSKHATSSSSPGYIIISINKPIDNDVSFNWWIIN